MGQNHTQVYLLLVRLPTLDLAKHKMFSLAFYLTTLVQYIHVHVAYGFKKSWSEPAVFNPVGTGLTLPWCAGPVKFLWGVPVYLALIWTLKGLVGICKGAG